MSEWMIGGKKESQVFFYFWYYYIPLTHNGAEPVGWTLKK